MAGKAGILFLVLFASFSPIANADGPGWTVTSSVVEVVTVANGGINVRLDPELNGCVSQSGYGEKFASIPPHHPGLMQFQSNLLAAMMAGKKVRLHLSDDKCFANEMRLFN